MPSATAWLCRPGHITLVESRAQFDTGFRVLPTQDGRVCGANCLSGTLNTPLFNQGFSKRKGLAGGEALGPAVTSMGAVTFSCPLLPHLCLLALEAAAFPAAVPLNPNDLGSQCPGGCTCES